MEKGNTPNKVDYLTLRLNNLVIDGGDPLLIDLLSFSSEASLSYSKALHPYDRYALSFETNLRQVMNPLMFLASGYSVPDTKSNVIIGLGYEINISDGLIKIDLNRNVINKLELILIVILIERYGATVNPTRAEKVDGGKPSVDQVKEVRAIIDLGVPSAITTAFMKLKYSELVNFNSEAVGIYGIGGDVYVELSGTADEISTMRESVELARKTYCPEIENLEIKEVCS